MSENSKETQWLMLAENGGSCGCVWGDAIKPDPSAAFPDAVHIYRNGKWIAAAWYGVRLGDGD